MVKTAGYISGLAGWLLALGPSLGIAQQRILFPSPVGDATPAADATSPPAAPALPGGVPTATTPVPTTPAPTTTPTFTTPPALPAGTGAAAAPAGDPPVSPWSTLPPGATFQGGIQTPPAWDPYGNPAAQPPSLFPQDPFFSAGPNSQLGIAVPATRLLHEIRLEEHWFASIQPDKFGMNDIETYVTWAFPFFWNTQTPLLVTPGFAIHLWDGPQNPVDNLPPRVYDAYLDAAWNPQPTPWLGGELSARLGVYSDFSKVVNHSLRITGKGLATLTFSPSFKIEAGVWYLNRIRVTLLPAGGIVWTPNSDVRFDILFPNPKFSKRIITIGTTDWRFMVRGEYGGGVWTVKRLSGDIDQVNYNDIRIATGLEFDRSGGIHGMLETGVAFSREILFRVGPPASFYPTTTVFIGGAIAY